MVVVIPTVDGRHIEAREGLFKPAVPPETKGPSKFHPPDRKRPPKAWPRKKRKTHARGDKAAKANRMAAEIPGFTEWSTRRAIAAKALAPDQGGTTYGHAKGMRRCTAKRLMAQAREQAQRDMENIKKAVPDLDPRAEEALEEACVVLRGTGVAQVKLSAARLILDFTKAKPAATTKHVVQSAEDWLNTIATEDNGE